MPSLSSHDLSARHYFCPTIGPYHACSWLPNVAHIAATSSSGPSTGTAFPPSVAGWDLWARSARTFGRAGRIRLPTTSFMPCHATPYHASSSRNATPQRHTVLSIACTTHLHHMVSTRITHAPAARAACGPISITGRRFEATRLLLAPNFAIPWIQWTGTFG